MKPSVMQLSFGVVAAVVTGLAVSADAAVIVPCPTTPISATRENYVNLTVPDEITASCYDYGQDGSVPGNGQYDVVYQDPLNVVLDNNVLELPTGNPSLSLSDYLSGTFDSGTSGTFTFLQTLIDPVYLVLKTGGGQNSPYWFAFQLDGITEGTQVSWALQGKTPLNGLSNTNLFGTGLNCAQGSCPGDDPPVGDPPVPEPATLVLLGAGLLGAGIARRRRQ